MTARAPLGRFLRRNPFANGWTDGLFYREKMRPIHRVAPPVLPASARVLEIGGGRSGLAAMLYPCSTIITLDIDPALGAQQSSSSFICGDACRLPFEDASFDLVTLFDVLEHIPDDRRAAAEAGRVTRPGGYMLISTPVADWHYPYYGFMDSVCPPESELMTEWGHVRRGYDSADLAILFGGPADRLATFINPVTAFFHDIAFSRLGSRRRRVLYGIAALPTALAYALHRPSSRGTETAAAWRR